MIENLNAWLPTLVAGGAIALLWNDIRNFKKEILEKTKTLQDSLFRQDGESVYMPRTTCFKEQTRCQNATCEKIDSIAKKLDDMNKQREIAKEHQVAQMADIKQGLALLNDQVERLLENGTAIR